MRNPSAISLILACVVLPLWGCTAGEQPETAQTAQPIIGGQPAGAWEFPATGGLVLDGEIFCTGTLVAPSVVLTAAHCIDPQELDGEIPGFTLVRDEAEITEWGGEVHRGLNVMVHPGYLRNANDTSPGLVNDLGILYLQMPVEDVDPEAVLSEGGSNAVLTLGKELTIVGYGYTDTALTRSGIKFRATTPLVYLGSFELQMSEPGDPQPCYGDSGGPVFVSLPDGSRAIAGIVSRGPGEEGGCDTGAIATRMDPYKAWVDGASGTESCSTSGRSTPPVGVSLALLFVVGLWLRRRP